MRARMRHFVIFAIGYYDSFAAFLYSDGVIE